MERSIVYMALFVTFVLFLVGGILSIVGLVTTKWMVSDSAIKISVGLFEICQEGFGAKRCVDTTDESLNLVSNFDEVNFITVRILIIAGAGLGIAAAVSAIIFAAINREGQKYSGVKGPFIATMICAISSVICLGLGLIMFAFRIYDDRKNFYDLDYSFILNGVAGGLILIGCFIFPLVTHPYLKQLQSRSHNHASGGVVMASYPY